MTESPPLRVCVVDDDVVDRQALRRALAAARYRVALAEVTTVDAALVALTGPEAEHFDLVFLDFDLPGGDGLWVLEQVRARALLAPIIILTGTGDEESAVALMKAGATDYLIKDKLSAEMLAQRIPMVMRAHRAERELRRTQERLRVAVAATGLATWEYDAIADRFTWDARAYEIFGLRDDRAVTLADLLERIHADDRSRFRAAFSGGRGSDLACEFRVVPTASAVRWVRAAARAFAERDDPAATGRRWVGTYLDVTESRAAEHALRVSEQRYRALVQASAQMVWTTDAEGQLLAEHLDWGAYTGQSAEAFQGSGWLDAIHPDDRETTAARWRTSVATRRPYDVEYRVRRADGVYRWFHARAVPVLDERGDVREWVGAETDVHDRKQAEAALQEETQTIETLNRIGRELTAEVDEGQLLQRITDHATRSVGAQFGAFFYNVLSEAGEAYMLFSLSGAPREAFERFGLPRNTAVFHPTFAGEGTVRFADVTQAPSYGQMAPHYGMPEGHLPVRSYLAVPVRSAEGTVLGGLFFGHGEADVFTARHERLVEGIAGWASIALANARLVDRERRAKAVAQRAVEARDEVLAIVSHDLRNPLHTIVTAVTLLNVVDLGAAQRERQLAAIQRASEQMTRLLQDLLDIAKIEAGRLTIERAPFEVEGLLEEACGMFSGAAQQQGLRLDDEPRTPLPLVDADRGRVLQALSNLLGNALRHTERGGVRLEAAKDGDGVRFSVIDTGTGIDGDALPYLFDRFWQAPGSKRVGAGLGLAIVKGIVSAHGGRVWVESTVGQGSAFHFTLPAARGSGSGSSSVA